jgi:hypothetical protein
MKNPIRFPDPEKTIIYAVNQALALAGETGIRVAVRKTTPQEPVANKQITVRADGGTVSDKYLKEESIGLNLFVRNADRVAGYAEANRLAYILEAFLPVIVPNVPGLRHISVTGITAIVTDTEEQQRYIRVTALFSGLIIQL